MSYKIGLTRSVSDTSELYLHPKLFISLLSTNVCDVSQVRCICNNDISPTD